MLRHRRLPRFLPLVVLPLFVLILAALALTAPGFDLCVDQRTAAFQAACRQDAGGTSDGAATPARALARAWERAREAGSYRITSDVRQTLQPRPLPRNAGKGDAATTALHVDGEVVMPDRARLPTG
jgi:hypothetical protein